MNNCIEKDVCPVPKGSGAMETQNVGVENPLPCVVIILHGVNDIAEAFPNLDKGICDGLNQRLGRSDLYSNDWQVTYDDPDNFSPRESIIKEGYSPIIPFFWGYRPVDKEAYKKDQQEYKSRLANSAIKDPELPYDSYWIEREVEFMTKEITVKKLNCDKFGNWIDSNYQRNGGPFSDATSCIPDMYGPGMAGGTTFIGKLFSSTGAKVYDNPHRIYLAYAAHRLARLIRKIRTDTKGQDIPINIVAHSQGTIITMLANLIIAEEDDGMLPADCVILAHSPYAFEPAIMENTSKSYGMGLQTAKGREQTFINFVNTMYQAQRDLRKINFEIDDLKTLGVIGCIAKNEKYKTETGVEKTYDRLGKDQELFYRDNFGKVYCYSSPNDHVVSLRSVQGMGWKGIPDEIIKRCQYQNIKQRIFSHGHVVGINPDKSANEYRIPLVLVIVEQTDYPQGISQDDYQRRVTSQDVGDTTVYKHVGLTMQQLHAVRQSKLFKERQGELISGFYINPGDKIYVLYKASQAEFKRDFPEQVYQNVNSGTLKNVCQSHEQQMILDDIILKTVDSIDRLKAKRLAERNCSTLFPGDISTANYIFTTRLVNGEQVPEPMIYEADKPSGKSKLSRTIHYNDLYHKNSLLERLPRMAKPYAITRPNYIPAYQGYLYPHQRVLITEPESLAQLLADHPEWDRGIKSAHYVLDKNSLIITAYLTQAEFDQELAKLESAVEDNEDVSSHHSGITMNQLAPKHIMAYDLAIGLVKGIKPNEQSMLREWRNYADWRSPANTDSEAITYMTTGILPPELKRAMNYPHLQHMPKTVVNTFKHYNFTIAGQLDYQSEICKSKYAKLTQPAQWELPEPDLTEQ